MSRTSRTVRPAGPEAGPVLAAVWLGAALLSPAAAQPAPPAGALAIESALPEPSGPRLAAPPAVEYLYDDGAASVNVGPPSSFDPDMLWGNYFLTEPGGETLTEVAVAFGPTFPSAATGPVTFWVLDDPDADADPRNATAVARVEATPDVFGNAFFRVALPPTPVRGGFFVGASARLLGGQDRPARLDTDARADRSWFFYAPDIAATIDSLAGAPFGTRMDDAATAPFPGAFMVRALGRPAGTSAAEAPPAGATLHAPTPNPASGRVSVRFALDRPSAVALDVFDALGRHVATLAGGERAAGDHEAWWDARDAAPGVYAVRLRAGAGFRAVRLVVAP